MQHIFNWVNFNRNNINFAYWLMIWNHNHLRNYFALRYVLYLRSFVIDLADVLDFWEQIGTVFTRLIKLQSVDIFRFYKRWWHAHAQRYHYLLILILISFAVSWIESTPPNFSNNDNNIILFSYYKYKIKNFLFPLISNFEKYTKIFIFLSIFYSIEH